MQVADAPILLVLAVKFDLLGFPRYKLAPCKRRSQGKILFSFFSKRVCFPAPFPLLSPENPACYEDATVPDR